MRQRQPRTDAATPPSAMTNTRASRNAGVNPPSQASRSSPQAQRCARTVHRRSTKVDASQEEGRDTPSRPAPRDRSDRPASRTSLPVSRIMSCIVGANAGLGSSAPARRIARAAAPRPVPGRRRSGSPDRAPESSASTRSLAENLLTAGLTDARFPRIGGATGLTCSALLLVFAGLSAARPAIAKTRYFRPTAVMRSGPSARRDPELATGRAEAISAIRPLAHRKRGAGRARGAGSAYPRQNKSRALRPSATTTARPTGWRDPEVAKGTCATRAAPKTCFCCNARISLDVWC